MQISALGNKIKTLRKQRNISQSFLAEQIGVSSPYIGFLESGERKGSNETIGKIARYFNLSEEDLISLRDEVITIESKKKEENELPTYIHEFVKTLSSLEGEFCIRLIGEFNKSLEERLSLALTPYDIREIKQLTLDVKKQWINNQLEDFKEVRKIGYLRMERNIFIDVTSEKHTFMVTFLHSDCKCIDYFSEWIGDPTISFGSFDRLPHLSEKQKVYKFLWFSPIISTIGRLDFIKKLNLSGDNIKCNELQLSWFLQKDADLTLVKEVS